MSIGKTTLRFPNEETANRWFEQVGHDWIVIGTEITLSTDGQGGVLATVRCAVRNGGLVPAQRKDDH